MKLFLCAIAVTLCVATSECESRNIYLRSVPSPMLLRNRNLLLIALTLTPKKYIKKPRLLRYTVYIYLLAESFWLMTFRLVQRLRPNLKSSCDCRSENEMQNRLGWGSLCVPPSSGKTGKLAKPKTCRWLSLSLSVCLVMQLVGLELSEVVPANGYSPITRRLVWY